MNQTKIDQLRNDLRAAILVDAPIFDKTEINLKQQLATDGVADENLLSRWHANQQRLKGDQQVAIEKESNRGQTELFLSIRYQAAIRAFEILDETPPILDCLAVKNTAKAEIKQVTRRPMHYLCLVLIATLVSLTIFKMKVLSVVDDLRADIALTSQEEPPPSFEHATSQDVLFFGIATVILLFMGWLIFGGIQKLTMRIGGSRYINFRTSATVVEMTRLLINGKLEPVKAACLSMDLSGIENSFRNELNASLASATDEMKLISTRAYYTTAAALKFDNIANERTRVTVIGIGGLIATASILLYCAPPLIAVAQDLVKATY